MIFNSNNVLKVIFQSTFESVCLSLKAIFTRGCQCCSCWLAQLGLGHVLMLEPCTHTPTTSRPVLVGVDADATAEQERLASTTHS